MSWYQTPTSPPQSIKPSILYFCSMFPKLKYSTTDIEIKADFNANVDVGTQAFAVIISDRLINFQSDGKK